MDEVEDNDLKFLRATSEAISDIKQCLPQFLNEIGTENESDTVRKDAVFSGRLKLILTRLDFFQEDPQLLDAHLKEIIAPVIEKTLVLIRTENYKNEGSEDNQSFQALTQILYALCKVRGEKVVQRFLNSEPRYLQPILSAFGPKSTLEYAEDAQSQPNSTPGVEASANSQSAHLRWQARYVFLLWLAHLLLAPFDLRTISSETSLIRTTCEISIPDDIPPLAKDVITVARQHLDSASRDQKSAAAVLVVLALRPDMRNLGLLDSLIEWSAKTLENANNANTNLLVSIGALQFINGVVSSANVHDITKFLSDLFSLISSIFNEGKNSFQELQSSAITKKLAIKIERNIIGQVLLLGPQSSLLQTTLDPLATLEEVIDYMLRSLADRETPVRYATSKALGIIASKLGSEMAEDVVEAILGSFNENVIHEGNLKNFNMVDPLQWHGLTLTLSHMLFRRSPTPVQLPNVLNALYSTLCFEQRSAAGNSVGSNVRDAANFGLWSLARRYTTEELELVPIEELNFAAKENLQHQSAIQRTAVELLVAACLDPHGNIRRGSSAALQELVGRHPNIVADGISLVQIVDYHAVGLRQRAMVDVALQAGGLSDVFRQALTDALLGWRGVRSLDVLSRAYAATSFSRLCSLGPPGTGLKSVLDQIIPSLRALPPREVEWRHGLLLLISETVSEDIRQAYEAQEPGHLIKPLPPERSRSYDQLWSLFSGIPGLEVRDFGRVALHTELMVDALLPLIEALSKASRIFSTRIVSQHLDKAISTLTACLIRAEPAAFDKIPTTVSAVMQALIQEHKLETVKTWLQYLKNESNSNRSQGLLIAISSAYVDLASEDSSTGEVNSVKQEIERTIILASEDSDHISTRVAGVKSIQTILKYGAAYRELVEFDKREPGAHARFEDLMRSSLKTFLPCILKGLDDYTINERGDVGSLVRLEAVNFMNILHSIGGYRDLSRVLNKNMDACILALLRLSLEKLDKVRLQAAKVFNSYLTSKPASPGKQRIESVIDVSTYEYFFTIGLEALSMHSCFQSIITSENKREAIATAYLKGIISCTGSGSESIMLASRDALYDLLDCLPLYPPASPSLLDVCSTVLYILQNTISSASVLERDRVLPSQLETIIFLLDTGIIWRLKAYSLPSTCLVGSRTAGTVSLNTNNGKQPVVEETATMIVPSGFKYMTLLSLTQKAHFKSTSLPKLFLAIRIYAHLAASASASGEEAEASQMTWRSPHKDSAASNDEHIRASTDSNSGTHVPARVRSEALKKLLSMLVHPYARVRVTAAEATWHVLCMHPDIARQVDSKTAEQVERQGTKEAISKKMKSTEWGAISHGKGSDIDKVYTLLRHQYL